MVSRIKVKGIEKWIKNTKKIEKHALNYGLLQIP